MSQPLLTVVAEMYAKPGQEGALRAVLLGFVEPTRREEGCVQYDVHESNDRPGHFLFYENWRSQADLDKHAASEHLKPLFTVVPEMVEQEVRIVLLTRIA
jgi:quinol monooxygenase YgiN